MTFGARLKGLEAAVKRLEAAAGMGRRHCAFCRYYVRHSWPDPDAPERPREDYIEARCEFCRSKYTRSLAEVSHEDREAYRLHYSFTLEDLYVNPKAHALSLWVQHRTGRREQRRAPLARGGKKGRGARALSELREAADELLARKHERLDAEYGGPPFPDHVRLVESVESESLGKRRPGCFVSGLSELEGREADLAVCAELEKIIWGRTRSETASALQSLGREIEDLIKIAEEENRRREEERKRKDMDFLNNNRKMCGLPPLPYDYYDKK